MEGRRPSRCAPGSERSARPMPVTGPSRRSVRVFRTSRGSCCCEVCGVVRSAVEPIRMPSIGFRPPSGSSLPGRTRKISFGWRERSPTRRCSQRSMSSTPEVMRTYRASMSAGSSWSRPKTALRPGGPSQVCTKTSRPWIRADAMGRTCGSSPGAGSVTHSDALAVRGSEGIGSSGGSRSEGLAPGVRTPWSRSHVAVARAWSSRWRSRTGGPSSGAARRGCSWGGRGGGAGRRPIGPRGRRVG